MGSASQNAACQGRVAKDQHEEVDLGGQEDIYPNDGPNDVVRHGSRHGLFGDFPAEIEAAIEDFKELVHE